MTIKITSEQAVARRDVYDIRRQDWWWQIVPDKGLLACADGGETLHTRDPRQIAADNRRSTRRSANGLERGRPTSARMYRGAKT